MSFWTGFAQAFREKSERDYNDKVRAEDRKHQRASWMEQFKMNRKAKMEDFALQTAMSRNNSTGSSGSTTKGKSTKDPSAFITGLHKHYGVSQESLAKIAEAGDPTAFEAIYNQLTDAYEDFIKDHGSTPEARQRFNEGIVGQALETVIATSPSEVFVFNEEAQSILSQYLGETTQALLNTTTTKPGTVVMQTGAEPKITPNDVGSFDSLVKERLTPYATNRKMQIENTMNYLRQQVNSGTLDENQIAATQAEYDQLAAALEQINKALSAADKDNLVPLEEIFGGVIRNQLLEQFPQYSRFQ